MNETIQSLREQLKSAATFDILFNVLNEATRATNAQETGADDRIDKYTTYVLATERIAELQKTEDVTQTIATLIALAYLNRAKYDVPEETQPQSSPAQ